MTSSIWDDEARASNIVANAFAVGSGFRYVGAEIILGVTVCKRILEVATTHVQVWHGRCDRERKGGPADATLLRHRIACLIRRTTVAIGTGSVNGAVGRGVGVIGPAHVDLGCDEPIASQEQRQRYGDVVAFTVIHGLCFLLVL